MKSFTIRNKTIDGPLSLELALQLAEHEDTDEEYVYAAMRLIKKRDAEIERLRTKMTIAAMRLHGLAKMGQFSSGAVDEVAGYLDDSLNVEQNANGG